jgi:ParB family chromosome partitioning protein
MSRKALGRGLKALIPEGPVETTTHLDGVTARIPVADLRPNPFQPRKQWSDEELVSLAESIRANGLLEPILVRPAGDIYEIVAGERRARAVQSLGWSHIEATVRIVSDEEALQLALVENLQRKDLNPIEEARGYQALVERFDWTHEQVAHRVGKSRVAVSNALRIMKLPESIQDMVSRETLSSGHARALLAVSSQGMQERLAEEVMQRGVSVRQLERKVRQLVRRLESRGRRTRAPYQDELLTLQEALTATLGMSVSVSGNRERGAVKLKYSSREELEGFIARLGVVVH